MSNEYPIAKLADFLTVPEDSLDECLADFKQWLAFARDASALNTQMDTVLGISGSTFLPDRFTWINDGISGLRYVDFVNPEDTECVRIELIEVQ